MKTTTLLFAVLASVCAASIAFGVERGLALESPEVALVVGAIVGTQLAAILHRRTAGSANTLMVKCLVGIATAVAAVVFGLAVHLLFSPFKFVEVSVPMAAVGSFVFPFVLFDTMWKSMGKASKPAQPPARSDGE